MPRVSEAYSDYQTPQSAAVQTSLPQFTHGGRSPANLPQEWRKPQHAAMPVETNWARCLKHVPAAASTLRHFQGRCITNGGTIMYPGELVLACTRNPEFVVLYLYMPGGFWYRTDIAPVAHIANWCELICNDVRDWLGLSYRQRIWRACTETIITVRNAKLQNASMLSPTQRPTATQCNENAEYDAILQQFEQIRLTAIGTTRNLAATDVQRSLRNWIETATAHTGMPRKDVIAAVQLVLHDADATRTTVAARAIAAAINRMGIAVLEITPNPSVFAIISACTNSLQRAARVLPPAEFRFRQHLHNMRNRERLAQDMELLTIVRDTPHEVGPYLSSQYSLVCNTVSPYSIIAALELEELLDGMEDLPTLLRTIPDDELPIGVQAARAVQNRRGLRNIQIGRGAREQSENR